MGTVQVLQSFAGDHGSFAKGRLYTLPDAITEAYIYHGFVQIYKDKTELPIAKLLSNGKEKEKATRQTKGKTKGQSIKRKTKKGE